MKRTYLIGHWALTLLIAPFVSQVIDYFFGKSPHQLAGLLEVYPITLLFSIIFSAPTFLIYMICFYFLERKEVNFMAAKFILIAISVLGILITQTIIKGSLSKDIIIAYSVTAIIVGIVLKLKDGKTKILDKHIRT